MKPLISAIACLPLWLASSLALAQDPPQIFRLDQDVDQLIEASPADDTTVLQLAKTIFDYQGVYAQLGLNLPILYAETALGQDEIAQDIAQTQAFFAGRDLTKEVRSLRQVILEAMGEPETPSTSYYLAYGYKRGTNARTRSGSSTPDGRTHVYLNLVALARQRHWETAVLHETVHTLQDLETTAAATLLEWSILEGIPTYLSWALQDQLSYDLTEADALFWSPDQWQAAEQHRHVIIQAFAAQRHETDASRLSPFLRLDVPLSAVPGAPSRSGYYVGFLAVQAWVRQNPGRSLPDLFSVPPEEFWQALQRELPSPHH